MLKLQFKDRRQESIWLVDTLFTIGSSPENSLVVNEPSVEPYHAEIHNDRGIATIKGASPNSRLLVNGHSVSSPTRLNANDMITVGDVEMNVIDPQSTQYKSSIGLASGSNQQWQLRSTASWMENRLFPIDGKAVLGRDPSCNISIPIEHLSRRHLELEVIAGKLQLRDLNSSNGTFLNGKKIQESTAKAGDKIKVDVVTFEVIGPATDPDKTIIRPVNETGATVDNAKTSHKKKAKPTSRGASPAKKPLLASQGKQPWIEESSKAPKKKTNYWWYAIAGFSITVLGVIILSSL